MARSLSASPPLLQSPQVWTPSPEPAQILLNCGVAREAGGRGFPRFNPALPAETSSPKRHMDVFSENTTPVEMFAIFFVKCYFFHIRGPISCNSWRVPGGRRARKLCTEGSGDYAPTHFRPLPSKLRESPLRCSCIGYFCVERTVSLLMDPR